MSTISTTTKPEAAAEAKPPKCGYVAHGPDKGQCEKCHDQIDILATARFVCDCDDEAERVRRSSRDLIPVGFADGTTWEVDAKRVEHCMEAIDRSKHYEDEQHYGPASYVGAAAIVATELRAAASDNCRKMGELQRVVRDMMALACEYQTAHHRFCDCELCAFWSSTTDAKSAAAERSFKVVDKLLIVASKFLRATRESAPDYRAYKDEPCVSYTHYPFRQLPDFSAEGIEASRERLAASRNHVSEQMVAVGNGFDYDPVWVEKERKKSPFYREPKVAEPATMGGIPFLGTLDCRTDEQRIADGDKPLAKPEPATKPKAAKKKTPKPKPVVVPPPVAARMSAKPAMNGHHANGKPVLNGTH